MVRAGVIKPTIDFRKSYTLQFVNKAWGWIAAEELGKSAPSCPALCRASTSFLRRLRRSKT